LARWSNRPRQHLKDHCEACGHKPIISDLLEVDHILPRSRGGSDKPDNLQTLCAECHKIKTLLDRQPGHPMRGRLLGSIAASLNIRFA
jgi:5-methylcytosine-specific restriction endonuclease McrA